jgi:hypothetical protein
MTNAKIDGRKTEAFREAARDRARRQWTFEARATQSVLTREKLKSPSVRERISAATKEGMVRRRERQLATLRETWRKADKRTRVKFLVEIAAQGIGDPDP